MNNKDYISHVGWYNEGTKQFEKLYREEYVEELKDKLDIFMLSNKSFLETINNLRKENARLNKIIDELEKWLEERLEKLDLIGYDDEIYSGIEYALNKLKELMEEGDE